MEELTRIMKGILLLQLQQHLEPEEREKVEVVLGKAGFPHQEIAEFLGKTKAAVSKSISRAK